MEFQSDLAWAQKQDQTQQQTAISCFGYQAQSEMPTRIAPVQHVGGDCMFMQGSRKRSRGHFPGSHQKRQRAMQAGWEGGAGTGSIYRTPSPCQVSAFQGEESTLSQQTYFEEQQRQEQQLRLQQKQQQQQGVQLVLNGRQVIELPSCMRVRGGVFGSAKVVGLVPRNTF